MRRALTVAAVVQAAVAVHVEFRGLITDGMVQGHVILDHGDSLTLTMWSPAWPSWPLANAAAHGILTVSGIQLNESNPLFQLDMNHNGSTRVPAPIASFDVPLDLPTHEAVHHNFRVTNLGGRAHVALSLSAFCNVTGLEVDAAMCLEQGAREQGTCLYDAVFNSVNHETEFVATFTLGCQCPTDNTPLTCTLPDGQPSPVCCPDGSTPITTREVACHGSCWQCVCR